MNDHSTASSTSRPDDTPDGGQRYGIDELVQLAIDSGDVGTHSHERYQVLRRLLKVRTDVLIRNGGPDAPKHRKRTDEQDRRTSGVIGAPGLAHKTVNAARTRTRANPFNDYLEAPPDIHALYAAHHLEMNTAMKAGGNVLGHALRRLAVAAIVSAEPEVADHTVTITELRAAGWPDPPLIADDGDGV